MTIRKVKKKFLIDLRYLRDPNSEHISFYVFCIKRINIYELIQIWDNVDMG